jgi:hypothetical protein
MSVEEETRRVDLDSLEMWDGESPVPTQREVWFVTTFTSLYLVSSFGRIIRVGGGPGASPGRVLRPIPLNKGYYKVMLRLGVKSDTKQVRIHRLVALTFLRNVEYYSQCVHHKDKDSSNNRVSNLEWTSYAQNRVYQYMWGQRYG